MTMANLRCAFDKSNEIAKQNEEETQSSSRKTSLTLNPRQGFLSFFRQSLLSV